MSFGNNPVFRWLLGWTMPPKISFLKLTQTKTIKELYDKHHVVQDLLVPLAAMKDSILTFGEMINVSTVNYAHAIIHYFGVCSFFYKYGKVF